MYLAPVVQKVDNAIHRINLYPLDRDIPNIYPLDIVIFPVDIAIQLLNNSGQYSNRSWAMTNHSARCIHIIV